MAGAGRYEGVSGATGCVMVQVEGMGRIAGPPARGTKVDVGRAEAREQMSAAAGMRLVGDARMVGGGGDDEFARCDRM